MRELFSIAWKRFNIISSIVSDGIARTIAIGFYFTILVPFGAIYTIVGDPLRKKPDAHWIEREPVPSDMDSARLQG